MNYPNNELFEKLADIEHQRWVDWQKHLHSKCDKKEKEYSGALDQYDLLIPSELVMQWTRQIKTDYKDLSEKEKDSDRDQVMRYWNLIN